MTTPRFENMEREEIKQHLNNIIGIIADIQDYIKGMNYEDFTTDQQLRENVYEDLQQIGQAADELSNRGDDMVENDDAINRLSNLKFARYNETMEIDHHSVWNIIRQDLPEIAEEIEQSPIYAKG